MAGGGGVCSGKFCVAPASNIASGCAAAISFWKACGGAKAFSNGSLVGLATPGGEAYWRDGRETGLACDT